MTVFVDLPAVRPGRLADGLVAAALHDEVCEFRPYLRGAHPEPLPDGIRLVLKLDLDTIARLAEVVRGAANALPFWRFRLLAEPPACWLEVTGAGRAGERARAVFAPLGT